MDLLAFERKLDQTIMRKRVDIQETLKRPMKVPYCVQDEATNPMPRMGKQGIPLGWTHTQPLPSTTLFISTAKAEAASLYLQYF